MWIPPKLLSWYWQLEGTLNMNRDVACYDIDCEDNTAATVTALHQKGIRVIAYFSAGTAENWRSDYSSFPASVKGPALADWPGEFFLDVRQLDTLRPIMEARADVAVEKGFDAIEWDNIDGYQNPNGFGFTAAEQLTYNRMLADIAHARGLSVFQKNDPDQVSGLLAWFDGAIDEQCAEFNECDAFDPYLNANKPVLEAEYGTDTAAWNDAAIAAGREIAYYNTNYLLNGNRFIPHWVPGTPLHGAPITNGGSGTTYTKAGHSLTVHRAAGSSVHTSPEANKQNTSVTTRVGSGFKMMTGGTVDKTGAGHVQPFTISARRILEVSRQAISDHPMVAEGWSWHMLSGVPPMHRPFALTLASRNTQLVISPDTIDHDSHLTASTAVL